MADYGSKHNAPTKKIDQFLSKSPDLLNNKAHLWWFPLITYQKKHSRFSGKILNAGPMVDCVLIDHE
jgi:hypothetical protein